VREQNGFTLVEVIVSIVLLAVALLTMAATSGGITRTLTVSRMATDASLIASERLEVLRASAAVPPKCTSPAFASSVAPVVTRGVTETWQVPTTGTSRQVRVMVSYRGNRINRTDTVATVISCK
jgi:prepilin-type N-terminal cleavage/methylation domain-containing protein